MAVERPQFYANNLTPVSENELSAKATELRNLVSKSLELVEQNITLSLSDQSTAGDSINTATRNAIALLYVYLAHRQPSSAFLKRDYLEAAAKTVVLTPLGSDSVTPRKLSPLNNWSILSDFVAIAIISLSRKDEFATKTLPEAKLVLHCKSLIDVINFAISADDTAKIDPGDPASPVSGIDEVLQGRAGLLWGLLLLRQLQPEQNYVELKSLFSLIPDLVYRIALSGTRGWNSVKVPPIDSEPQSKPQKGLLWPWINTYYGLGAIHGATGILSVLLTCPEAEPYHAQIAASITHISSVCIPSQGHLPMSEPPFPSKQSRAHPLVQLCHGATGFALLLCFARENETFFQKYVQPEWIEAEALVRRVMWREGLLSKGLGVCHGVAGTALPWVLGAAKSSEMLGSTVALLLEIGTAPPLGKDERFREPDSAFGIMEGLVGTVMVWNEAILAVEAAIDRGRAQTTSSLR